MTVHLSMFSDTPSLDTRIHLISHHPFFCFLGCNDVAQLALAAVDMFKNAGEVIVTEGELLTSFYLIQSGTAAVQDISNQQTELKAGDAIGLTNTGFYSQSGMHPDSVMALSSMTLLAIDIKTFYDFLIEHHISYPTLKYFSEKFLCMQVLKTTTLYQSFSNETLAQLLEYSEKVVLSREPVGVSDIAGADYVLLSGQVTLKHPQKGDFHIHAPAFLGNSLLNKGMHLKTATPCELMIIKQAQDIPMASHACIKHLRLHAIRNHFIHEEDKTTWLIGADVNGVRTAALSTEEHSLWAFMKENISLKRVKNQFPRYALQDIYDFVLKMQQGGFLELKAWSRWSLPAFIKGFGKIKRVVTE